MSVWSYQGSCYCNSHKHEVSEHPVSGCLVNNCCHAMLTPAAQAVLDAALEWQSRNYWKTGGDDFKKNLLDAIRRYRETQAR